MRGIREGDGGRVTGISPDDRTAFNGARGVTQGDPLSPTIFNAVVDAVVPLG